MSTHTMPGGLYRTIRDLPDVEQTACVSAWLRREDRADDILADWAAECVANGGGVA